MNSFSSISKKQLLDFLVFCLRWYLAFYMINYGYGKIMGSQFDVDPSFLNKSVGEVSQFHLSWYLFGQSSFFKIVVGSSQIVGGLLLLFNRTVLIGALLLFPILIQIFLIDVLFTVDYFGFSLPVRLLGMMICAFLILLYNKEQVLAALRMLTNGVGAKFNYKWWVYPILLLIGFLTDFISAIILYPLRWLLDYLLT